MTVQLPPNPYTLYNGGAPAQRIGVCAYCGRDIYPSDDTREDEDGNLYHDALEAGYHLTRGAGSGV